MSLVRAAAVGAITGNPSGHPSDGYRSRKGVARPLNSRGLKAGSGVVEATEQGPVIADALTAVGLDRSRIHRVLITCRRIDQGAAGVGGGHVELGHAEATATVTCGHETTRAIVEQPTGATDGQHPRCSGIGRGHTVVVRATDRAGGRCESGVYLSQHKTSGLGPHLCKNFDLQLVTIQVTRSVLPLGHVLARQNLNVSISPAADSHLCAPGQDGLGKVQSEPMGPGNFHGE